GKVSPHTEVQRMEADVIPLQDLFEYKIESVAADRTISGRLYVTGLRPVFVPTLPQKGHQPPPRPFRSRPGPAAFVAVLAALPALAAESGPRPSESAARFPDRYYFLTLPNPQRL